MSRIKILFVILVMFSTLFGYGQLHLGVRGGYNISSINFIPDRNVGTLYDWVMDGGIILKYFDLEYVGFQGEINFTERGYRLAPDNLAMQKRINSYLEVPLFFQIRAKQNNLFGHINLGIYTSFLLSARKGILKDGTYQFEEYRLNILRDNIFDFGLPGGLGVGYNFKGATIQLDLRYFFGLGDLYYYNYKGNPARSPAWVQNVSLSFMYNLSSIQKTKPHFNKEQPINDNLEKNNQR